MGPGVTKYPLRVKPQSRYWALVGTKEMSANPSPSVLMSQLSVHLSSAGAFQFPLHWPLFLSSVTSLSPHRAPTSSVQAAFCW